MRKRRIFALIIAMTAGLLTISDPALASGFLFPSAAWPYGYRDGLDPLDDNPASGENESGVAGEFSTFSAIPHHRRVFSNTSVPEWGAKPWPRWYDGEPAALQTVRRNRVYYPLTGRGRVSYQDWSFAADVRLVGGRIAKFTEQYYFTNPSTANYDRIRLETRDILQVLRFRLMASRELGPELRAGAALQVFQLSFDGFYAKYYDYLGRWSEYGSHFLRMKESCTGQIFSLQAGAHYGRQESKVQFSGWLSLGGKVKMKDGGRWETDEKYTSYSQTLEIALPPQLELTARIPLIFEGWGLNLGVYAEFWNPHPFKRSEKPLDIPEPAWRPAFTGMAGFSYIVPDWIEFAAGYRFEQAAGNDHGWENSITDKDLNRVDLIASYTFDALVFRAFAGGAWEIKREITDPAGLQIGASVSYFIR